MKEKFYLFMRDRYAGRYGLDALSKFLFVIMLILSFVPIIIRNTEYKGLTNIFSTASMLVFIYMYFRLFSKDLSNRYNENQKFLSITSPMRKTFNRTSNNVKDRDFKYITCGNCKQELRIPRHKGKIMVTCKKCKHKFQVRT